MGGWVVVPIFGRSFAAAFSAFERKSKALKKELLRFAFYSL